MKDNHSAVQPLHIAVGAIINPSAEVLIARRPPDVHQGGLWEFPGGKVEAGESVNEALQRELSEELAISVNFDTAQPLIQIRHDYPDRQVLLDVWRITEWHGKEVGREGQAICWAAIDTLSDYVFPAPNRPIIQALKLPACYAIIEDESGNSKQLEAQFNHLLEQGITVIQLRAKQLSDQRYRRLALKLCTRAREQRVTQLLNRQPAMVEQLNAGGIHLTSRQLMQQQQRPLIDNDKWVAASCHTLEELQQAARIGVDFVVLGAVLKTKTHPDAQPLGWQQFAALVATATVPVYALGGVGPDQLEQARHVGAQGVAGIRAFLQQS